MMRSACFALGMTAICAVAAVQAVGTTFATPSDSLVEAVVYTTLRPQNWDIYLSEEPGKPPRQLTDDPALDYNAVFSPDGRWVVFTSERAGSTDLYALDLTGEGRAIRLTYHFAMDDAATFSPDGQQLAFVSTRDGYADIFVMPFVPGDASAEQQAVNLTRHPGGNFNPAFSPDGQSIAFSRQVAFTEDFDFEANELGPFAADLYVMVADGSNVRRLSEPGALSGSPAWSPDGSTIYYHRFDFQGVELRRIAPDGSGDALLVPDGLSPAVLPDGRIGFSQLQPGPELDFFSRLRTGRIHSVTADGSDLRSESDALRSYFAPDFDRVSGRMLSHGQGTVDFKSPLHFAPPDARRQVSLPDRSLELIGIRGQFPALTPQGTVISSDWSPPLITSKIDGDGRHELFMPEAGEAWGAAVAGDTGAVVVAVGPRFAGAPFGPPPSRVDIWKLHLDGSGVVNLTADSEANDALPHISADGNRIVFRSDRDGSRNIYIMDGDGGNLRRLTNTPGTDTMPALSPDGEWVVFPTDRAGGMKLFLQPTDGSEGRFLEPERLDVLDLSMHPRFSPDGLWVVFTSSRSGFNDEWPLTWFPQPYGELWAVPVAGGQAVRLTHDKWEDGPSDWGWSAAEESEVYKSTIVQGIQLHYQIEGEGDPLILVHGSLADLRYWEHQVPALSGNLQVITYSRRYNYPNDNRAMPDHSAIIESGDLLALMDELGLDSASILGHSYGAYTALWFALEHPDRVDKLILAEAPILRWLPEIPGGEGIMEGFMSGVWEPLGKAYSEGGTQAGLEASSQWYFGEPLDAIEEKWRIFFKQNSREWEALTASSDAFPYIDMQKVENLELPVLLISGARNAGNFNDLIDSHLSTLLPDARRVVIENAGHEMFLDNPHDTNQAIVNFLDQQ